MTIPFDSVTTFIGPNGAGKSTVLRALDWFFNGKPGSLTEKDCSFGATTENIEVQVTFADLTDKQFVIQRIPNGTSFMRQITPRDAERYFGVTARMNF